MPETTGTVEELDELRSEIRWQFEDVRRELRELRQLVTTAAPADLRGPSREEIEAGLAAMRSLHESILRHRGGELLPPVAEEIARLREDRTAQMLGEASG